MKALSASTRLDADRVWLRVCSRAEEAEIQGALDHPSIHTVLPMPFRRLSAGQWCEKALAGLTDDSELLFSIFALQDDAYLGGISLHRDGQSASWEMGYWLMPDARGKGLMRDVLKAMLEMARNHPSIKRVTATAWVGNVPSQKVLLGAGFIPSGVKPHVREDGSVTELLQFTYDIGEG